MGSRRRGWIAVVMTVTAVSCGVARSPAATIRQPEADPVLAGPGTSAVQVLHTWDAQRARAWSHGDRAALARLYLPGSAAGRADLALLDRYRSRGLVVRRMRMQLLQLAVLTERSRVVRLRVTDRLAFGVVVGPAESLALPRDAATARTLTLRKVADRWVLASSR